MKMNEYDIYNQIYEMERTLKSDEELKRFYSLLKNILKEEAFNEYKNNSEVLIKDEMKEQKRNLLQLDERIKQIELLCEK